MQTITTQGRETQCLLTTVEIDGSQGEGGGQILRTALALSVITQKPLAVRNIRAKRPKPGLMRQHLACVHAAQAISDAQVSPVAVGATELHFAPRALRAGQYEFPISGAGSSMLVLQTAYYRGVWRKKPISKLV